MQEIGATQDWPGQPPWPNGDALLLSPSSMWACDDFLGNYYVARSPNGIGVRAA
jgi:hypothetical protein